MDCVKLIKISLLETKVEKEEFDDLFHTFHTTSTVHGVSLFGTSRSLMAKLFWILIVTIGLVLSIVGIDECFKGWNSNPVITAVWQMPIESVNFPSITICPMGQKQ